MNIMRKILSQGSTASVTSPTEPQSPSGGIGGAPDPARNGANQESKRQQDLSLSHLQRLFRDYQHPGHPLGGVEKEEKVYMMLPLFCKVFGDMNTSEKVSDTFPDSPAFAQAVSRLLVTEVRRRASNQSTEEAAEAIAIFMEMNELKEDSSRGWMLLSALNILESEEEVMTSSSVPSTLVKCLYLFFDLKPLKEESSEACSETQFTQRERRILLQKMLIQILLRLCANVGAAEELARKDDLTLLFSAITSSCPKHNLMWRKTAADILLTISRHSLSQPVISYLHNKGCIALCIDNMQKSSDISPLEIVEMFVSVFCFLKDSCQNSQTLMDDFRTCQGYVFLSDFLLKLDKIVEDEPEANEAIRNLVLLVASLSFCGLTELKMPSLSNSIYQIDSFKVPNPENRGSTVKNVPAVQVLQSVFLKATSEQLTSTVLDAVSTIYNADNANYFLLIEHHILSQFAERLARKPLRAQEKFFQILEYVVFHLKFVPCKELVSVSLLLKAVENKECACLAIQTLINVLSFDKIFKEVFREVGMVEVLVGLLTIYNEEGNDDEISEKLEHLTIASLESLLASSSKNVTVFRDLGGVEIIISLVKAKKRRLELDLMKQVINTSGKDEDMTIFLEMLHFSLRDAELKSAILKTLYLCLRDSHRSRTVFRKVGGFVYVLSILVGMEGSLSDYPRDQWKGLRRDQLHNLINSVFSCLAVAMRYEPANARYFQVEMNCEQSIVETIKLLGCFAEEEEKFVPFTKKPRLEIVEKVYEVFVSENPEVVEARKSIISDNIYSSIIILRALFDMALDNADNRLKISSQDIKMDEIAAAATSSAPEESRQELKRVTSLNLSPTKPDPIIVHPGIVVAILKIMPHLYKKESDEVTVALQLNLADVLKNILRVEKNQQIMCDAGLVTELLKVGSNVLEDEAHILHDSFQTIFERLAYQKLDPIDLRNFLRLGNPLSCLNEDERQTAYEDTAANEKPGSFLPLTRIKTLVSMTTPRESHCQNHEMMPPFIELDMSPEGFGCLFLPSVAPHNSSASSVVGVTTLANQEGVAVGGIGQGYRAFPPASGITFSTWVNIEKFSDPRSDPHPVRLLTVSRQPKGGDEESNYVCLSISLSARDRALVVSTKEVLYNQAGDWQPDMSGGDHTARIWFPDLIKEGEWHHIVVILGKQNTKTSSFSLYVNGQHITTQKLHFMSPTPGGVITNAPLISNISAFIGTPPSFRRRSRLCWKQGPCLLIEEPVSQQISLLLFKLGAHYIQCLQSPQIANTGEVLGPQVNEEKVLFGLNALAVSLMTLSKIRRIYNRVDSKGIAKQLGMSTNDNATPIRIIHNSAGHLQGPARSMGGVVIGYLGVRVFAPQPVTKVIETVGGCDVLLGIVAMAKDVESLYAGVKSLLCVLKSNPFSRFEMEKGRGYQIVAMLFRKKKELLNSHVLYLVFTMAGTVEPGKELSSIPNVAAFRDILCDLDLWHEAPENLEKTLLDHFHELLVDSNLQKNGGRLRTMRECRLVDKLLTLLPKVDPFNSLLATMLNVIHALLTTNPRVTDVLSFALFIASTLDPNAKDEKGITLPSSPEEKQNSKEVSTILLRNQCLKLFHSLLYNGQNIHQKYCEDMVQVVGFDWIVLFVQGYLHSSTVIWGLKILTTIASIPSLSEKFRTGTCNGHWLMKSEVVLQNKMIQALGQTSTSSTRATKRGVRVDIFAVPGFQLLNWVLPCHCEIPEMYFLLLSLALGKPMKELPENIPFNLDACFNHILGAPASSSNIPDLLKHVHFSGDAIVSIMTLVRALLNNEVEGEESHLPSWLKEYPITLIQIVCYLYHNVPDFMPVFMTDEVTTSLVGTLFPIINKTRASKASISTPTPNDEQVLEDTLSNHPAKKQVLNFMRGLILDSLSLQASTKTSPVIDLLLDAKPLNSNQEQQKRFQTELLDILMDHLLAADVLIGDQAALPISPKGSVQNIPPNVFYVASRIVDKLWQGIFKNDPDEVFQFILKLIAQAKRGNSSWASSLEGIYRSLNRTILYLLSRPHSDVASKVTVLEVLHKITSNRGIIFGAGNHELEFFGCITFCLLQISAGLSIPMDTEAKTTWHVYPEEDLDEKGASSLHQGQNLLANAASRVWKELYVTKREAVEEAFKISFGTQNETPDLETVRTQVSTQATKIWFTYVDMELKCVHTRTPIWEFHTQLESRMLKLTKDITGGLVGLKRLASVTGSSGSNKNKKEELPPKVEYSKLPQSVVEQATLHHVHVVRDVVEQHQRNIQKTDEHMLKFIEEEWLQTEAKLTQERGLWGPKTENPLTKWMLDLAEGPSRKRQRLIRNNLFFYHYPYRCEMGADGKTLKYKKPMSLDSKKWHEQNHDLTMFEREEERIVELEYDDCDISVRDKTLSIDEQIQKIGFSGLKQALGRARELSSSLDEEEEEYLEIEKESEESPTSPIAVVDQPNSNNNGSKASSVPCEEENSDYQTVMRLLEEGEQITHLYRCARIQGLDTAEGLMLFGKEYFYMLDGFTLVNGKEVQDISGVPANRYEPIIPVVPGQVSKVKLKRRIFKFSYDNIKEVHKRRYLLQPISIEIFFTDGQNHLLAFNKQIRGKVYQRLLSAAPRISDSAQMSVSGQKRTANVEQGSGIFSNLIGETSVTQRWVRGEISNFQYLMALNSLAGRSYNDLMQYPVFPWVLADYKSEELDLTNPSTFRDLSKPMGAQTEARMIQFSRRFEEWDDPHVDTPPYHYGTHYSSAMIVSSYLVRMEPFTQHFLHLQGGHFDLADRMFHSIEEAWESASKNNMADLRELIPEFYYLPDFLLNDNKFDLGSKQSGESLDNVILPPWAKGCTREFIRAHREALECDYVSSHLHEWIDLIFGYKQQGAPAVEAVNVFHHLFYEGNVDIFSIEDPLQRNATIGFINNFGQIPRQLFKGPHPSKRLNKNGSSSGDNNSSASFNSQVFFHHLTNLRPTKTPIKELKGPVGQIQNVDRVIYAVEENKILVPGNSNRYLAWGFADQSFRLGNYDSDKAIFVCEPNYQIGQVLTCVCPNSKVVLTAGTSTVVSVYEYHKKVKQLMLKTVLYGHTDAVTCLVASPEWNIAVSGSRDRTGIIWDLSRYSYVKQLPDHVGPVSAVTINELTGDIVTSSGSWLYLWDINGKLQAFVNTAPSPSKIPSQILCICCSQYNEWDRENVIMTGSSDGVVRMWSIDYLEVADYADNDEKEGGEPRCGPEGDGGGKSSSTLTKKMSTAIDGDHLKSIREVIAEVGHDEPEMLSDNEDNGNESQNLDSETEENEKINKPIKIAGDYQEEKGVGEGEPSKATLSNSEDFVVISNKDLKKRRRAESGDGYTWIRNLVFRAKLTMHTAFERDDNCEPAAVTAISVSKDHKTVYVGDEKGRVFSWTVSSKPGKGMVDHWCKDEGSESCLDCGVKFTIYERRHHCRSCGKLFCSSCSQYQANIPKQKIHHNVRVCKPCHDSLKSDENK